MYMKNVMYKILVGCYIVAALVLVTACNDGLDIQQAYPFTVETLPVPKKLKVGETAEIRCQLVRGGYYQPMTYQIRYFQPDGKGKLEMDDGTVFLPNDLYPLEKETFRLYYTSESTDQQTPTSRRLTFISSTASGRCSSFRSISIMTMEKKRNYKCLITQNTCIATIAMRSTLPVMRYCRF